MKPKLKFLSLCALSLLSCSLYAADITPVTDQPDLDLYFVSGELKYGDGDSFKTVVENTHTPGKNAFVVLDSYGGNVYASLVIADYVDKHRFGTIVLDDRSCYSACFFVFMVGTPRIAEPKSSIGVHRTSLQEGENYATKGLTVDLNEMARQYNVPASVRLAMLETPSSEIYILNDEELRQMATGSGSSVSVSATRKDSASTASQSLCGSVRACFKEFATYNNSSDYEAKFRALRDNIIPQLLKLTYNSYTAYQAAQLDKAVEDFVRQCEQTDAILQSAGVTDNYSVFRVRSALLGNLVFDLMFIDPNFMQGSQEFYSENPPIHARFEDIHNLAFADRYNELRELCQAGFCNEEAVKEQERAWIRRSEGMQKVYDGTGYQILVKEMMIDRQIDFINTLKYVISSRNKDRTYVTRLDFSSNRGLMNSVSQLFSKMSSLGLDEVAQYNAVLGAYVIPFLEYELSSAGYSFKEYNDLSLTGGAYDLVYREFFVSSNRMFYGKDYNRAPTEYVKLEGKILRVANMLMLLLKNGDEASANLYKCNQTYCSRQDSDYLYDAFEKGVKSLERICKKKKCNLKQLQRMRGVLVQYDKLLRRLAAGHQVPHVDHVMSQERALVAGRVLREYDSYSK
ncbi:MAG: hypothetical protein IJ523_02465 [Succinivibrionaceae bacterium]|nr:hypothetical protein [Succinivibrionaceae bacterium]